MSFKLFFCFSPGLKKTINVPKGTFARMMDHVAKTEQILGIERETYMGRVRWNHWPLIKKMDSLTKELLCSTVEEHNATVRWFYELCEGATAPTKKTERLSPKKASQFWLGLGLLELPVEKWSAEYYRSMMEAVYECLRGRESEGMVPDCEPMTPKQAEQVISLFSQWLDHSDIRLAVKKNDDCLSSSNNGEYEWCAGCGAVDEYEINFNEELSAWDDYCCECQEKQRK